MQSFTRILVTFHFNFTLFFPDFRILEFWKHVPCSLWEIVCFTKLGSECPPRLLVAMVGKLLYTCRKDVCPVRFQIQDQGKFSKALPKDFSHLSWQQQAYPSHTQQHIYKSHHLDLGNHLEYCFGQKTLFFFLLALPIVWSWVSTLISKPLFSQP